jgi:hypothetical protein
VPCGSPHQRSLRLAHQKTRKEPKTHQHTAGTCIILEKNPFGFFRLQRLTFYCCSSDNGSKNMFLRCATCKHEYVSPKLSIFSAKFTHCFRKFVTVKSTKWRVYSSGQRVFFTPVFVNVIPFQHLRGACVFFSVARSPPSHLSSQRQSLRLNERRRPVHYTGQQREVDTIPPTCLFWRGSRQTGRWKRGRPTMGTHAEITR